jgi:hypothetical protein
MAHDHSAHAGHDHSEHLGHEHAGHGVAAQVATGAIIAAVTPATRNLLGRVFTHPLVMFGLGVAAGYFAYKYRQQIVDAAMRASEVGRDYVLNRKETLEDLVEEAKERAETQGGGTP